MLQCGEEMRGREGRQGSAAERRAGAKGMETGPGSWGWRGSRGLKPRTEPRRWLSRRGLCMLGTCWDTVDLLPYTGGCLHTDGI